MGEVPYPSATVAPAFIEETVTQGEVAYSTITLGNVGDADLEYSLSLEYNDGPFALGLDFPYYGTLFNSINIGIKGWLSFTSTGGLYNNQPIPSATEPNDMLAPFWDDLNPNFGGTIYYFADTTNDRFIVQWDAVSHFPDGPMETFQAILNVDGSIVYQYHTVNLDTGCTVGIENAAGTDGLEVIFNTGGYLHDGLAIRFAVDPGLAWLSVAPASGIVEPLGDIVLDVTMDATELEEGTYYADVQIATNDPDNELLVVPVTLTVGPATGIGDELPRAVVFFGAVPNPFNPMTSLHFSLPSDSRVDLKIYDVAGRQVRSLVSGPRPAGANTVRWNGTDDAGHAVASGTYFARLVVGGQVEIKTLTLVR
jgi:hypothetical protein